MVRAQHAGGGPPLSHQVLLYGSGEEYTGAIVPFVEEGRDRGEPAMVAVPGWKLDVLRGALGGRGGEVEFVDMAGVGRNPRRIIPEMLRFAEDHAGHRTRFVGEPIWPGRSAAELREAARHEALVNLAFAGTGTIFLCPYDRVGLGGEVIAAALRSHPQVWERNGSRASPAYAGGAGVEDDHHLLSPPPSEAAALAFHHRELSGLRSFVTDRAASLGLAGERLEDMVLATSEVASNALVHSGAPATLRIWRAADTGAVVCELSDHGHIPDALAGRRPPSPEEVGGRGLWLVNQVCDLVELYSGHWGTIVRLHVLPG
jgi:anti-sigma regulatory factor (Ser/Thr protein kinase)